ncbi:MAG: HEAT repeat domain-containing protein [Angustibacter sp.]
MAATSRWGLTPRQSIEAECRRRGGDAVVAGCRELLAGRPVDPALLLALGGPGATKFLDGGEHDDIYWLRVWAARGLLWAWDDEALPELLAATVDDAWRVREMAAKVVARHEVGEALDRVVALRDDPVARVRAAAERAVVRLTAAGA